jgi:hypothetical protein
VGQTCGQGGKWVSSAGFNVGIDFLQNAIEFSGIVVALDLLVPIVVVPAVHKAGDFGTLCE